MSGKQSIEQALEILAMFGPESDPEVIRDDATGAIVGIRFTIPLCVGGDVKSTSGDDDASTVLTRRVI